MRLFCTVMEIWRLKYWTHGPGHRKKDGKMEREKGRGRGRKEKRKVEKKKEGKEKESIFFGKLPGIHDVKKNLSTDQLLNCI